MNDKLHPDALARCSVCDGPTKVAQERSCGDLCASLLRLVQRQASLSKAEREDVHGELMKARVLARGRWRDVEALGAMSMGDLLSHLPDSRRPADDDDVIDVLYMGPSGEAVMVTTLDRFVRRLDDGSALLAFVDEEGMGQTECYRDGVLIEAHRDIALPAAPELN